MPLSTVSIITSIITTTVSATQKFLLAGSPITEIHEYTQNHFLGNVPNRFLSIHSWDCLNFKTS